MNAPRSPQRLILLLVNVLLVVLAWLNLRDLRRQPFQGYAAGPARTVVKVSAGSPAERAGLKVGDRLVTVGGLAVADTRASYRRGRPAIGETWPITVERAGQPLTVDLTFAGLPPMDRAVRVVALIVGLCFGLFGLMAYLRSGSLNALLFAAASACFGWTFVGPPYVADFSIRAALDAISVPVVIAGFAALLHFVLRFPAPARFLARPGALTILYAPAAVLALMWLYLFILRSGVAPGLTRFVQICFVLAVAAYCVLSAGVLVRSYARATAAERGRSGLNLMLWGVLVGFAPLLLVLVVETAAPAYLGPAGEFAFATMAAIPITFAMALARHERAPASMKQATSPATV
jgi:hypothetical protein